MGKDISSDEGDGRKGHRAIALVGKLENEKAKVQNKRRKEEVEDEDQNNEDEDQNNEDENGEDDEEQEDDEEEDDEEEDDEEEEDVGIALNLPKRASRAKRYAAVLQETQEGMDEFWQHETWAEEHNDDDYNCSEGEDVYEDVVDSDFDKDELEESEEDFTVEIEKEKKKKTNVYQDPSLQAKQLLRKGKHTNVPKKKAKVSTKTREVVEGSEELNSQVLNYDDSQNNKDKRETRATTRVKSKKVEALQLEREERKRQIAKKKSQVTVKYSSGTATAPEWREPSQKEHLLEAQRTEKANKASLIALEEWEVERKRYAEYKKQRYQGHYDIWICWASDRLIISDEKWKRAVTEQNFDATSVEMNPQAKYFKQGDDTIAEEILIFTDGNLPEIYKKPKERIVEPPRCAVTGNVAKYLDPLTHCFYDSAQSFKVLRQWYHDEQRKNVIQKLLHIETLIDQKAKETSEIPQPFF